MKDKQANRRIRLLLAIFVLVFAGTLARAVWLQGVRAASLGKMAERQHHETITIPAGRGTIYDAAGVQLAIGETTTTLYADPRQLKQPRAIAVAAQKYLGVDANTLYPQLLNHKTSFVYIKRFADSKAADAFLKKASLGVNSYPEEKRTYPQRSVASQVIGFAGTDNTGLGGLEVEYNRNLTGKTGKQTIVRDPFGRAINVLSMTPEQQGHDLFTTIDHTIQANAEQVLRATVAQWHAKSATAIVLEPSTGRVLAMAMQPGYNANQVATKGLQGDAAVSDVFEPGSVFKVVTIAGALSEGVVTPQTRFTLPYSIHVADRVIHDAELRGTETMTVSQILQRSSNVGTVTIARDRLGQTHLKRWIGQFGFGKRTDVDLPGESAGLLPSYWSGSTIGNVPIGQGVSVTALQLASVYGAIANRGVWKQPHLVDHMQGEKPAPVRTRRILSAGIDRELLTMLRGVVSDTGTGGAASVPGYSVAGKTGTAQKPSPTGGYAAGKYVATFVGMVPAKNPRLVVLVTVDEPKLAIFGGVVAAPAFSQIAAFDLQYLEVPPDQPLG
jgi:cell division protein FtsI (penicillin-binding protein 3)/stage V sporulation protein D (sporulation-specific penicillin-binding protein)